MRADVEAGGLLGLRNTYSNFIRGQRRSLVSAALAVIGVSVFVCLTLRKRGLMPAGGGGGGGAGPERGSGRVPGLLALPVRLWRCRMDKIHEQAKPLF